MRKITRLKFTVRLTYNGEVDSEALRRSIEQTIYGMSLVHDVTTALVYSIVRDYVPGEFSGGFH